MLDIAPPNKFIGQINGQITYHYFLNVNFQLFNFSLKGPLISSLIGNSATIKSTFVTPLSMHPYDEDEWAGGERLGEPHGMYSDIFTGTMFLVVLVMLEASSVVLYLAPSLSLPSVVQVTATRTD